MKALPKKSVDYLFDHIVDGYQASHKGLIQLKLLGIISEDEYLARIEQNTDRFLSRISEFKIKEKLICISFALIIFSCQLMNVDLDALRRPSSRTSKRKTEIIK